MKPLHKELKDIRIEKGISLDDISRETKIRLPFLEKIEEGEFTAVPEPFMRAFLREYAEVIGLEPDRVIAKYEGKGTSIREEDFWKHNPQGPKPPATPPEKPAPKEERAKEPPVEPPAEPSGPAGIPVSAAAEAATPPAPADTVKVSMRVIDDAAPEQPAIAQPKSLNAIMEDEDRKSPKVFFMVFFVLVVIIAAVAILYINGTITLPF